MMRVKVPLGPFRLVEAVGAGAMGRVWRAEHRGLGTPVAVKVLTRAESPDVPVLFAHEVRAVARLSHPAIIRIHDHGVIPPEVAECTDLPDGAPYLVMEWLPGGSLRQQAVGMSWPQIRRTLLVLLDALAHAHARGVIHRDLKPDNVLVSDRGPVLTDFGVAASLEEAQGTRLLVGTPNYMAPEQIRGDWRALGPWTDLYAMGCLAWQLISGAAPFAGRGREAVLRSHINSEPPELQPRMPVPVGFEPWVRALLAKAPHGRPRFAAEAAQGLLALEGGEAIPVGQLGRGEDALSVLSLAPERPVDARESPPVPTTWRPRARPRPPLPLPGVGRALVSLREVELHGRDRERDILWRALRRVAERGRPMVVMLEGPSGYGKSRLAAWLGRRAHELGVAETLIARHQRQGGPGLGLGPMLARALRCADLPAEARLGRLVEVLGADEDETAFLPALAALTEGDGTFAGAGGRVVLGSEAERHATLRRALGRLAGNRPLIVHLDDMQWGLEALRFCTSLLSAADAPPLLVVGTVRQDGVGAGSAEAAALAELHGCRAVRVLPVGPLPADALVGICRAILPLSADVIHGLIERAEGSPLYAEELIRHWIRTDALESSPEGFRLKDDASADVPAEVGALWLARLGEVLGSHEQAAWHACELAAALGMVVQVTEWKGVCALAEVTLAPDLGERLQAAWLLVRDDADGRLRFAHPMLREALRARAQAAGRFGTWNSHCATLIELAPTPDAERQAHHLLAARRLREALEPLRLAAQAHLERGDPLPARRLILARARTLRALGVQRSQLAWLDARLAWAEQAAARGDHARAARQARQVMVAAAAALNAGGRLPELALGAPEASALQARALVVLGRIGRQGGAPQVGLDRLNEAILIAGPLGDLGLLGQARLEAAWCLARLGRLPEADLMARQVVRLVPNRAAPTGAPSTLRAEARYAVASIAWLRSRCNQAELFGEAAFANFREVGGRLGMARSACLLGDIARARGEREIAEERYRESLALLDAAGGRGRSVLLGNLALLSLHADEVAVARALLTEGRQEAQRSDEPEARAVLDFFLLVCDARSGRWRACESQVGLIEALGMTTPMPDVAEHAHGLARLAERASCFPVADAAWALADRQLNTLMLPAEEAALREERVEAGRRRFWPAPL